MVLLFTAGIALLTGILFGLAPAWQTFRAAPMFFLRESATAGETRVRRLFGKSLVVAQVALSVALLSAAGLFVRHLSQLEHLDLGFQRDHVLLPAWISTRQAAAMTPSDCPAPTRNCWASGSHSWRAFRHHVRVLSDGRRGSHAPRHRGGLSGQARRTPLPLAKLGRAAVLCDLRNSPADGARFQPSGPGPPARGHRQSNAGPLLFRAMATPSEDTSSSTATASHSRSWA